MFFATSRFLTSALAVAAIGFSAAATAAPKAIIISLDGAQPDTVNQYLADGTLTARNGLGLLKARGAFAMQNVTATPSLTAVGHIAIATGSNSVENDIPGNSFKLVVSPITGPNISGFGAPIGGYDLAPLGEDPNPTAVPYECRSAPQERRLLQPLFLAPME